MSPILPSMTSHSHQSEYDYWPHYRNCGKRVELLQVSRGYQNTFCLGCKRQCRTTTSGKYQSLWIGDKDINDALQPGKHLIPNILNTVIDGLDAYATSDLLAPHPTKPGYWRIYGRADDQIMHNTGEKVKMHILLKSYLELLTGCIRRILDL